VSKLETYFVLWQIGHAHALTNKQTERRRDKNKVKQIKE